MKPLLSYLILLSISALFITLDKPNFTTSKEIKAVEFKGDSGFILKPQAVKLLNTVRNIDTIDIGWENYIENDTVGKYYKTSWGTFYACILKPLSATRVIIEMTPENKILKSEYFYSGTYHCCWNNDHEGFQKHGDYYSVRTCGTGSGYCAGELNVFQKIPSKSSNSILESVWVSTCFEGYSCSLTSIMKIRNDTVFMNYTLEKGILKKKFKVKKTEKFDIYYTKKDSKWIASDSTNLGSYLY